MRAHYLVFPMLVLAACAPQVPDSGRGIGFNDDPHAPVVTTPAQTDPMFGPGIISDENLNTAPASDGQSSGSDEATAPDEADAARGPSADRTLISDEQNFEAVSARETIESDAERQAAQREAYQVIDPVALPSRSGNSGASVVEFALASTNQVGQSIYRRSTIFAANRFERNCAKYGSSDLAQEAFLKTGGPKLDRQGLDPDGDGFACYWDPSPFRRAVSN